MQINRKFHAIVKHMYTNTNTSVKLSSGIIEFFKTNTGIRQGDSLSPLMFCLYIDDIKTLFDAPSHPCKIGDFSISHLLFADDLIIFSETKTGLQYSIDQLDSYCKKWKLKINKNKTKILVFTNCTKLRDYKFMIDHYELEEMGHISIWE